MDQTAQNLLAVLRCAFRSAQRMTAFTQLQWEAMRTLAARHSVQNLMAYAVQRLPEAYAPPARIAQQLERDLLLTLAQGEVQNRAAETLLAALEQHGVDALAFKGVCTRRRYPDPVMRSMGDLDVLCRASDSDAVRSVMKELGYGTPREERKHDLYVMPPFVTVELHRQLLSAEMPWAAYYEDVWDRCALRAGSRCIREMTPEDEAVFNVVHLAEHLLTGGVGVRFVADVYVYAHLEGLDRRYVAQELETLGLTKLYRTLCAIAEHWFGVDDTPLADSAARLAEQILLGGTFGTETQAAALTVRGGRLRALVQGLFPSAKSMQSMFPWLEGSPALLPYAWALRAARALRHRPANVREVLGHVLRGSRPQAKALMELYRDCGLDP